ncbi:MAG: T9SS type A sorting domain-containing protein [Calditrichaceae bacterium]|nr:T9SS type A sorting domain-containing protein [Calditrichia bacterium]NUQ41020.1 T9SS type A sorting domain-containing protein [Calditrichaceae bacterium]
MLVKPFIIFCILGWAFLPHASRAQPFLSNLSATKNDPVYTTYAAALERSEFILDEGYQFVWYDPQRGINFETDQAGSLCLAFKRNGEVRYFLNQMHAEPVLTTSYSDLVKYFYYPFADIRVEIFLLVYSSRIAIQDIVIHNEGFDTAQASVYPFLHHGSDELTDVALLPEQDGFIFRHSEPPDGWTVSHGVPYQEEVRNVYLLDRPADAWGAYTELGILAPVPAALNLRVKNASRQGLDNYCVEWGLVYHSDGTLCYHVPPQAQQIVLHNGSDAEILTEAAPKWGDPDPNIPGNGYQGCELGHFDNPPIAPGDSFQLIFTCLASGEQGVGRGVIPAVLPAPGGVNVNIQLSAAPHPPVPQQFSATFVGNHTAIFRWHPEPGCSYALYRRNALIEKGEYDRIAEGITDSVWVDFGLDPNQRYGYILTARDNAGNFSGHSIEVTNLEGNSFFEDVQNDFLSNLIQSGEVTVAALQKNVAVAPGESAPLRIIRGVIEDHGDVQSLIQQCRSLRTLDLQPFVQADEQLYGNIPQLTFTNPDYEMLYWNAFSLIRQCMLPPEGECSYNYYVFSREPTWGWGHGGQVFHESLAMLAYVFMDSPGAMNSQRVYLERQWNDGYINYRTGPYLNETIPFNGQHTTSAPWYNWENWEISQAGGDAAFLAEAYQSGKKFYNYWLANRDADDDGLCEWGAHAVLECVRDGLAVIWDQVGWPGNFECLDLNVMLVNEARSLAEMAQELGYANEYQFWMEEANARSALINQYMWDAETGFYYHVDKTDHDFTFNAPNDLKRMEIIGFLPLWAGVASPQQAAQLLQHLANPAKFWRNYGIPTLAADDSYYNPLGYWNGPVWVEWQYLIFRGLLRYGYVNEARQLAEKVFDNVIHQLKTNHWFWELYSPDAYQAGHHKTYIWSGLAARMLIDLENYPQGSEPAAANARPQGFELRQNYPNPFNPTTAISYQLSPMGQAALSDVQLTVYNLLGQKVRTLVNARQPAGRYEVKWEGRDEEGKPVGSGVYFYRLEAGDFTQTRKMLLLR